MKDFDNFGDNQDDEVEIIDLDTSTGRSSPGNTRHEQRFRLSARARIWLALSTLIAAILLLVLILKPSLPSPAPAPIKPGKISISLPASAQASQVNSENGIAIINTPDGTIYALKANDGTQLWHFKAPTRVSVQVLHQIVYLISTNQSGVYGFVIALRASNGTVLWGQSIPYPGSVAPVISDSTVYVSGHGGGEIYALRASDGYLLWQYGDNASPVYPPLFSSLEEVDGRVYLLSADNVLYTLRASDGTPLWSYHYQNGETGFGLPTVEQGIVYFNGLYGAVKAFRASDGYLLWQYNPGIGPLWPALVQNGVVYISEKSGTMSTLRGSDGTLLHDYKNIGVVTNQPVLQNGTLYINTSNDASDDALEAFKASDNTLLWRYRPATSLLWPPQIRGNAVYIISPDGPHLVDKALIALQASTGSLLWRYEAGSLNYQLFRPSMSGNIAYLSLNETSMEGLRLSDGTLLWYYASHAPIVLLSSNNGLIYVSSQDGIVNTLQASDGFLLWHFP